MTDDDVKAMLEQHESAGMPRFTDGFPDRVMARIVRVASERPALTMDQALSVQSRRLLPVLAAASLVLGLWNWWTVRDRAPSTLGAVLGVATVVAPARASATTSGAGLTNTEYFE